MLRYQTSNNNDINTTTTVLLILQLITSDNNININDKDNNNNNNDNQNSAEPQLPNQEIRRDEPPLVEPGYRTAFSLSTRKQPSLRSRHK